MDIQDRRILDALQHDTRLTSEQLSQRVGLSPDACRKRLARLRASGVIEREIAVLSPEAMGRGLVMAVCVTLVTEGTVELDQFKERMRAAPEVMQCYAVTGASDFIVLLTARDMPEYEGFVRRHFLDGGHVARFTTSVVIERVKVGFGLPLGSDGA
jgi:Lrp/AsnC family leucine-responsive transcriptional regulator